MTSIRNVLETCYLTSLSTIEIYFYRRLICNEVVALRRLVSCSFDNIIVIKMVYIYIYIICSCNIKIFNLLDYKKYNIFNCGFRKHWSGSCWTCRTGSYAPGIVLYMAKYSYIHWSYGILHKQVCEMIATIRNAFIWRLNCGHTHEALMKLANKTNI